MVTFARTVASAPAMVFLDARFFPNIIDVILDSLDLPGSVVAAQVCRAWRKKANRVLQRHVVAKPTVGGLLLIPKTFDNYDARLPRYLVSYDNLRAYSYAIGQMELELRAAAGLVDGATVPSGSGPALPSGVLQVLAIAPMDSSHRELFDNIQVLDVLDAAYDGSMVMPTTRAGLWGVSDLVRVVKRRNMKVIREHFTDRKVYGIHQIVRDVETQVFFNIKMDRPVGFVGPVSHRHGIDFGTAKHIVLNKDYFPSSTAALDQRRGCQAMGLSVTLSVWPDEFVIVMRNGESWVHTDDALLASCAENVVQFLNFLWVDGPVTLVGLETFFADRSVYEEFRASLIAAAADTDEARRRHPWSPNEVFHDLGSRFSALTHEEYRERVGDAAYLLHTVQ
ncbi:hypothetical protein A1Q2_08424 [Trichosporon asahii var. asahii CBS 8904]|uniref:F-box domain-containing protein n=2 Tax=Trichosporon asahii var. asahii TaxID=189963 RepID=K1VE09_TRIAC|nr:hypothetical protein A1Q1_01170 [Trichosporon asahii var. asahii CBS 2479]EJT49672.1 hypothetical protein A1Q1_01170 [Trichosporon asahii var. asahii CBS 2479]EKC97266.1 hypothetical protein A1Q2_08424 [Trichosporon asahii var. asahii CBS 8904]